MLGQLGSRGRGGAAAGREVRKRAWAWSQAGRSAFLLTPAGPGQTAAPRSSRAFPAGCGPPPTSTCIQGHFRDWHTNKGDKWLSWLQRESWVIQPPSRTSGRHPVDILFRCKLPCLECFHTSSPPHKKRKPHSVSACWGPSAA